MKIKDLYMDWIVLGYTLLFALTVCYCLIFQVIIDESANHAQWDIIYSGDEVFE